MKTILLSIELSQEESQELVNYVASRLIVYEDRKCELQINEKIIISQPKNKDGNSDTNVRTGGPHTGYTVDSENLRKEEKNGSNKGKS